MSDKNPNKVYAIFDTHPDSPVHSAYISKARILSISRDAAKFYQLNSEAVFNIYTDDLLKDRFFLTFTRANAKHLCTFDFTLTAQVDLNIFPEIDKAFGTDGFPFRSGYYSVSRHSASVLVFVKHDI